MRILLLTDRYPPEARSSATLFQELAEALAKRGHEVCVLTKMPQGYVPTLDDGQPAGHLPFAEVRGGVRVVRLRGLSSMSRSLVVRAVDQMVLGMLFTANLWRCGRPDAVIVYSPPLPLVLVAAILTRLRGVPYVLNLHDLYPRTAVQLGVLKNSLLIWGAKLFERIAYRNAAMIVVPADGSRRVLIDENHVDPGKLRVIPNWVDVHAVVPGPKENSFRQKHGLLGAFVVSYAGVMGFAQDLTTIIQCARLMVSNQAMVFLLVGDGVQLPQWKVLAERLPNVRFLGPVAKDRYFDLLRASDVCLVPLDGALSSPAIPGKIQSIMAVGRPIAAIVPTEGEAARVVNESRSGWVVVPGDVQALRSVLDRAIQHPEVGEELGRNGRRFAEQHYAIEYAIDGYEETLVKVRSEFDRVQR
ncbi:MAG: glycosyltransferase family 4 protein [Nitrospirota bacterium]